MQKKFFLVLTLFVLSILLNLFHSNVSVIASNDTEEWISLGQNYPAEELKKFQGTLRYVPGTGKPDIVMRYNAYKLEQASGFTYDIYGGSDVLKPFIGKTVEIEGKFYSDLIETKVFQEIWPTRIRAITEISSDYVDPIPHLKVEREKRE